MRLLDETAVTPEISDRLTLGLNHEQQHQELLLTDIKHAFSLHPDHLPVNPELAMPRKTSVAALRFTEQPPGMARIGADSGDFCFDNETPGHEVYIPAHAIGSRLVTNGEFREFINEGGYEKHEFWLSDGWAVIQQRGWNRPLYWSSDLQSEFTLGGQRDLDLGAPVAHVSYYEADAFARWSNCRLPTEDEWERSAKTQPVAGNLLDSGFWHPLAAKGSNGQFFGDTWEWTSSAYAPYPGFKPLSGSLGEYNGKFMCNQMTVRGGSCVTAADHVRPSYRSFFYPDARWQFLGIRLAQDRAEER
jgi:ergothioneine biosynthesis protein EgtB